MFKNKTASDMTTEKTNGNGATLISAGTEVKGDVISNSDLRIDGTIIGNVTSTSKIIIGATGIVQGDVSGNQADVVGKVTGNIKTKDLLQLRGDCIIKGNVYAGKLQVEPTATFNGQCHMGNSQDVAHGHVVEMGNNSNESKVATK